MTSTCSRISSGNRAGLRAITRTENSGANSSQRTRRPIWPAGVVTRIFIVLSCPHSLVRSHILSIYLYRRRAGRQSWTLHARFFGFTISGRRDSAETQGNCDPAAKPDRQVAQQLPKLCRAHLRRAYGQPTPRSSRDREAACAEETQAHHRQCSCGHTLGSICRDQVRQQVISFCTHSAMNLHRATDSPMSGDLQQVKSFCELTNYDLDLFSV